MDSKSAGRKANLKQYRAVNGKWQFVPVVKSDGKPRPQLVLIDGKPESSKGGGKFYLEWYEDGRRKTKIAGSSPREALDAWQLQTGILSGKTEATEEPAEETDDTVVTIDAAIEKYLREVKATKGKATLSAYSRDLCWFRKHCSKHYVTRLTRDDIIALFGTGRDEGLNQKTINRRVLSTLMAMRGAGARLELKKGDWPKVAEVPVEAYEQEELKRFFAACEPAERLLFQVFLCTGFRSQEVATLTWDDVNWKAGTLAVRAKPELGFTPKNYEKRSVPVPRALILSLKEHRKANPESALVFPTPPHPKRPNYGGEKPDAHALEACKEIAHRAGLNCGKCQSIARKAKESQTQGVKTKVNKCTTGPHCKKWYLHKWRHTFATNMLRSNLDIRSLQILLGHKNIATTEKYLKGLRLADLRDKVEQSASLPDAVIQAAHMKGIDLSQRKYRPAIAAIESAIGVDGHRQDEIDADEANRIVSNVLLMPPVQREHIQDERFVPLTREEKQHFVVRMKIRTALTNIEADRKLSVLLAALEEEMFDVWGFTGLVTVTITPRASGLTLDGRKRREDAA